MDNIRIPIDLNNPKNVTFKLEQDFDQLEVLSLKVSTYDVYAQMSSDFGVITGRVSVNGGFGVQNAKVSVFIPVSNDDLSRPEILQLYPFKAVGDRLPNNVRYNIFPRSKQGTGSHIPIGIFPDITDLTYYSTYLEIYEKYYKFTTTTNDSGDYMIFGVPLGAQYVHMDFDLFDTKSFYLTADDMVTEIKSATEISAQLSDELNQALNPDFILTPSGEYQVKVKADIDAMPNIFTGNKLVDVIPFWGNTEGREIGITRCDFALDYQYTPTAIFFGSVFNSPPNSYINNLYQESQVAKPLEHFNMSKNLKIIAYKHMSQNYDTERFAVFSAVPNSEGIFIVSLPMYEEYYVTNEFGELVQSTTMNESGLPNGVPTVGHYVFEFFDDDESEIGNGRRSTKSSIINLNGEQISANVDTNFAAGIRVPASRNGWEYISGWDVNDRSKSEFRYDILKGTPRFYTTETKFRKHDANDLTEDGKKLYYLPNLGDPTAYNYPVVPNAVNDMPDGNITVRGSLLAPRFRLVTDRDGVKIRLLYADQLTWTPWKSQEETSNYLMKIWDWIYGIGVRDLEGINKSSIFQELYPDNYNFYERAFTWYFGENPENADEPPIVNFYARLLSGEPEANGRNINGVHNCFNLAADKRFSCGLFVSSVEFGVDKILYETKIVDVTDIMSDLIQYSVYSSYGKSPDHKYKDNYYFFGLDAEANNALYKLQERYFNATN